MVRLGVAEPEAEPAPLRSLLERAVPKNRGAEFLDLIEDLAHDTCVDPEPDCPRCDLRKICPTGIARKEEAQVAAKQAAVQARAAAKAQDKAKEAAKPSAKVATTAAPKAAGGKPPKGVKGKPRGSK